MLYEHTTEIPRPLVKKITEWPGYKANHRMGLANQLGERGGGGSEGERDGSREGEERGRREKGGEEGRTGSVDHLIVRS